MASGRFHAMVSLAAGILAGGAIYYTSKDWKTATALGGACLAGVIISPDLDEPNQTHSHTEVRHDFGIIVALLWWFFWQPYVWIVRRHRSLLSHFPVLSTAGRVGYLGTILVPVIWGLNSIHEIPSVMNRLESSYGIGVILQAVWKRIPSFTSISIPVPDKEVWIVFIVLVLFLIGLSILRVDLPQDGQKRLFSALAGIALVIATIWIVYEAIKGSLHLTQIPVVAWMVLGLCLSDMLHALVDWYLPVWL